MNNFEFIGYTPTPQEKHVGIATVKLYGKIVLRYKIVKTKDGHGTFPAAATYKIADQDGERYIPAFILDSTTDNESLMKFIKDHVKRWMNPVNASNSVFNSLPHAQNSSANATHQPYVSSQAMAQGTQNQDNLPF